MKRVYFLRHGECESNVKGSPYLAKEAKLTEKGVQDIKNILPAIDRIYFDVIISSSLSRAVDTANIIAEFKGLSVQTSDLFVEREHPSEMLGLLHEDDRFKDLKQKSLAMFKEGAVFSDEESFHDLAERATRFKKYLSERNSDNILVVGHGKFTKFFLAHLCFGEKLSPEGYTVFDVFTASRNLGLSEVMYDNVKNRWKLRQWNSDINFNN